MSIKNEQCYFIVDKRERPGSKRQTSLISHYGHKDDKSEWKVKEEYANKVKFENLDCGDVCFYIYGKPIVLIERKDVKDLAGCINSKSYKEQKFRMQKYKSENPQLKLVYLVEDFQINNIDDLKSVVNPAAPKSTHVTKQTILSSIVSTMFRDDFFVHTTNNIEGTISFIDRVCAKLPGYPKKALTNATADEGKHEYLKQIDVGKSKNIDSKSWYLLSLSQIPGVSLDKAKGIQEKYDTLPILLESYKIEKNKDKMLTGVPKIGKVLSKRIYEYFHCL
jgi:ERCC4-type nuclease